ncbi:hypothetical protein PATSB16_33360 [Pandoraea thiooxydans]|uniref:Small-conductance mechanosensitive channel n=1 Tax=Pandoraea thiooxydans TaxID=445709 RepID=A0A0G3EYU0_9BURK|nr:mechanosensitive ion channel family protein [Pandoraea thiooxydans]AKJ70582.2 mechanosensitive ion channel protein MscS [Pandoraea thiooxydans]APR96672.1 hypothetical protein PATSB16_33360 [Pandoraea thiooxydans]
MNHASLAAATDALWTAAAQNALHYGVTAIQAIVILLLGWWLSNLLTRIVRRALDRSPQFDKTLKPLTYSVVQWSVRGITIVAVLAQFGVQTASIIAVLGAAGLAIGLALQGTLQNIAAGTMLLVLRPFKIGDYISAGSSIGGTVEEIGLFTSTLTTADGVYMSVPNNQIWGSAITNYSRNSRRRMDITVNIDLRDDLDSAIAALSSLTATHEHVLRDPAPEVMVKEIHEQAVVINVRLWTLSEYYWAVYWELQRGVKKTVEAAGCSLPYPTRTIVMTPAPTTPQ